jgi:hypothetical protein
MSVPRVTTPTTKLKDIVELAMLLVQVVLEEECLIVQGVQVIL